MNYREEEIEVVPNAWSSELPTDILGLIADKLLSSFALIEFIKFGSVCVEWRSFSIGNYQHIKLPDKLPLLLIPIPPSSLLFSTVHHHHQKMMTPSSPPSSSSSSSSSSDDDEEEDYYEEEEKEEVGEEEKVIKDKGEVVVVEGVINKEEEVVVVVVEEVINKEEVVVVEEEEVQDDEDEDDDDDDIDEDEDEDEDDDDDDDDDDDVEEEVKFQPEHYYSPNGIWEGQDAKQLHKSTRTFYSLSEKRVCHDFQLPVPYYKNVRGSSYGWLVTVQECYADNGELYLPVSLLNPFRTDNNEIHLPALVNGYPGNFASGETICTSYFLKKAFLSANPSSLSDPTTQLVVLGVYGHNRLAFCRPGDKVWTRLDLGNYRPIQDIICYKGEFYAVLGSGYVFAFVFDAAQLLPTTFVTRGFLPPPSIRDIHRRYLVESEGDLLHVWRHVVHSTPAESGRPIPMEDSYITLQFSVFKLDPMGQWVEMKTLNNRMLFIGQSSSMSLSASDFPGWSRPNSIYYTDDYIEGYGIRSHRGPHDIGIFNLEDRSFERHYESESKTIMPPPIWIQPML